MAHLLGSADFLKAFSVKATLFDMCFGPLAQLVEHIPFKDVVPSSSLGRLTKKFCSSLVRG